MSVAANLDEVRRRIEAACERAGRDPVAVRLIGASKTQPLERVLEAIEAGLTDIGENVVQEAVAKKLALGTDAPRAVWHMIGHLQSNKAKAAIEAFDIIQSVDSLRLAEALSRRASGSVRVLLEVNVAGEASKFGFAPAEVGAAAAEVRGLPHLELMGLMTVAPVAPDPEAVRPVFRELRRLAVGNGLRELSMGMTEDFEVAVEEGATMIRIGRAIFGERAR